MSNLELLDRAAAATTCQILNAGGQALVGAGAVGIVGAGVGMVPLTVGAAMLLAKNYGCPDQPLGDAQPDSDLIDGCSQMATGGYGQFEYATTGSNWVGPSDQWIYTRAIRINPLDPAPYSGGGSGANWQVQCEVYADGDGTTKSFLFDTEAEANAIRFRINPIEGECNSTPDLPPLPPEMYDPVPYTDPETNCTFNLTLQGFAEPVPGGSVRPVYLMQQGTSLRSDGGRMGGCNWPDTIFMPSDGGGGGGGGGGDDGPVYLPVPPGPLPPSGDDGTPWWATGLLSGATAAALTLIGNALDDLFETKLPAGSFTLQAPCDVDEQGNPLTQTWTYPEQIFTERSLAHQITQLEALQTQLNWKTPTCGGHDKPILEGQWVTTRWESTEKMAHSGRRLRKLFRYRTKSTRDLGQLSAYWQAFTWQAGDVCVIHKGAWWGTPQVWASTEEEGQRVIRFAASEAGLDPDQVGEWSFSRSRAPRYGMSGTMTIELYDGVPWISSRDDPSFPNFLALTQDP